MNNNEYKTVTRVLIISLCVMICIFSITFAFLSKKAKNEAVAISSAKWDVKITSVETVDIVGSAKIDGDPKILSNSNAFFTAKLSKPNDTITYVINVENLGTVDALLKNIIVDEYGDTNSNIKYKIISGKKNKTILKHDKENEIKIKVYFDKKAKNIKPSKKTYSISLIYGEYIK